MSGHVCTWLIDNDKLICGEVATPYQNVMLCIEHQDQLRYRIQRNSGLVARQSARIHPYWTFPGLCYFGLLPDGKVKIGYSNTPELLSRRMRDISRQYAAPIIQLAVLRGGFVAEAVMHDRFKDYRVSGTGERFEYSPEMATFLAGLTEVELAEL